MRLTVQGDCGDCHAGMERAERIRDVALPSEASTLCRDCHVRERARFHWR